MVETLDPPAKPAVSPPPYSIAALILEWDAKQIIIRLKGSDGSYVTHDYNESEGAVALMTSLNKANLATKSLHRRVMEKLIADGKIVGSISGTPD